MAQDEDFMKELAEEASEAPEDAAASRDHEASLERLTRLVDEVKALDDEVDDLDARANAADSRKNDILRKELPLLMRDLKTSYIERGDKGFELTTYYKASIPEEHEEEAFAYLQDEDVDAGDLINRTLVVEFDKEFGEEFDALEAYVRERYQMARVSRKFGVPWARLTSWVKSILTTPEDELDDVFREKPLPLQALGVETYVYVKIDKPRPEGGKRKRRKK